MSAQAGIFYFDGRPIEPDLPNRLDVHLAAFGPDGSGQYVAPGLLMAHRALHVTPEDRDERQPYRSERGNVMTWDGRLDNRDDLLLQLWRDLRDDTTDVALAMAAYEKWGVDGFGRLIGDWSLALWVYDVRELTLASDYAGNRGLYYWQGNEQVLWSTSLGALVERVGIRECLEPRFIVGYLTAAIPPNITPYVDVRYVLPAHALTWSADRPARKARFWDLSVGSIRYRDPHEYEARVRELLRDAVAGRLRSSRPAFAELSGGLDSSTVVCVADRLLEARAVCAPSLQTASYVTDSSPESDERPFILTVERQRNKRGLHIKAEDCVDFVDDEHGWVSPLHPTGVMLEILRTTKRHGARVLLSGHPGDLIMGNFPESTAAVEYACAAGQPGACLAAARQWSRATRRPIWHVPGQLLTPHLSVRATTIRAVMPSLRRCGATSGDVLDAAAEAFLLVPKRLLVWWEEKFERAQRVARYRHRWQRTLIDGIAEYTCLRTMQSPSELPGILYTHSYTDRRLIEFVLAIPPDVLNPPGKPRLLMKSAFDGVLPPKIARRFSKGYVDPFKIRKVKAWLPAVAQDLDSLFVVREGYVDRTRLKAKIDSVCGGSCRALGNIEFVLRLERWVNSRRRSENSKIADRRDARGVFL